MSHKRNINDSGEHNKAIISINKLRNHRGKSRVGVIHQASELNPNLFAKTMEVFGNLGGLTVRQFAWGGIRNRYLLKSWVRWRSTWAPPSMFVFSPFKKQVMKCGKPEHSEGRSVEQVRKPKRKCETKMWLEEKPILKNFVVLSNPISTTLSFWHQWYFKKVKLKVKLTSYGTTLGLNNKQQ